MRWAVASREHLAQLAIGLLRDILPFPKAVRLSSLQVGDDTAPRLDFGL